MGFGSRPSSWIDKIEFRDQHSSPAPQELVFDLVKRSDADATGRKGKEEGQGGTGTEKNCTIGKPRKQCCWDSLNKKKPVKLLSMIQSGFCFVVFRNSINSVNCLMCEEL